MSRRFVCRFPLGAGRMAKLVLPADLTAADAARIKTVLDVLIVPAATEGKL